MRDQLPDRSHTTTLIVLVLSILHTGGCASLLGKSLLTFIHEKDWSRTYELIQALSRAPPASKRDARGHHTHDHVPGSADETLQQQRQQSDALVNELLAPSFVFHFTDEDDELADMQDGTGNRMGPSATAPDPFLSAAASTPTATRMPIQLDDDVYAFSTAQAMNASNSFPSMDVDDPQLFSASAPSAEESDRSRRSAGSTASTASPTTAAESKTGAPNTLEFRYRMVDATGRIVCVVGRLWSLEVQHARSTLDDDHAYRQHQQQQQQSGYSDGDQSAWIPADGSGYSSSFSTSGGSGSSGAPRVSRPSSVADRYIVCQLRRDESDMELFNGMRDMLCVRARVCMCVDEDALLFLVMIAYSTMFDSCLFSLQTLTARPSHRCL